MQAQLSFALYDYVVNGVLIIDDSYRIVFWNRSLEQLSKLPSKHVLDKTLFEAFPDLQKNIFKLRLDSVLQGGPPEVFSSQLHKYIIPCPNGNEEFRRQNTTIIGMHDETGAIFAVFSIQDVTNEVKQIETARRLHEIAMQEVHERKLTEFKLQTAIHELEVNKKQLTEMNASKDLLFSIIAHDLRSPLQGLIGYTHILITDADELTEVEKREFLQSTHELSKNLSSMIENLLEWARLQTEKIVAEPKVFIPREIIGECTGLLYPVAAKKEITLNTEILSYSRGFADINMVKAVVRNFISNAIKFTPRGGEITVQIENTGGSLKFSVRDSGVGIPVDKLENIFEIQKSKSTNGTEREEGTGLGLVLCKEFVTRNAGTLGAESEPGKGSTFFFTVPLAPNADNSAE